MIVDIFKYLIGIIQMLLGLPGYPPQGQQMVIAADAKADGPIVEVVDPGIGNRKIVQVDHVVKRPDA